MSDRLEAITRCTDDLAEIRKHYGSPNPEVRLGATLGELDTVAELHRLLYEYGPGQSR